MLETQSPAAERVHRSLFEAPEGPPPENGAPRGAEDWLWRAAGVLLLHKWWIVGLTALVAVVTTVILLLTPNWYAASARVLAPAPTSSSALTAALTKGLPSAAVQMLGGQGGDYARYLTILTSRRMYESVVDSFGLSEVYEIPEGPRQREETIQMLALNVSFPVDEDYEYLSVVAADGDPVRAADMANFIVRRLNLVNAELSSQSAGAHRRFIEARYLQAEAAADSIMDRVQAFQKEHGLFDVGAQTEHFFSQLAELRASAIQTEIQYETARAQLGPENSEVQALASAVRISNQKYQAALAGQEQLLPVAQSEMSSVMREYLDLKRDGEVQARILEVVRPMYEQARFDEQRQVEALQVVDAAVPPVRKAGPNRTVTLITVTLSAFLLAVIFVLLYDGWRRKHAYVAHRLRRAVRESEQARAHVPQRK